MRIVIDVPDVVYKEFKDGSSSIVVDCIISNAVFDGQVLPEGHGRLIDADELHDSFIDGSEGYDCQTWNRIDIGEAIDNAPTVIEADEEVTHEDTED